jgi:hypothetical protein
MHDSTIGQNILNLKYLSNRNDTWISRRQKILYAAILIGLPWLKERSSDILKVIGVIEFRSKVLYKLISSEQVLNGTLLWCVLSGEAVTNTNFRVFGLTPPEIKTIYKSLSHPRGALLTLKNMFNKEQNHNL